MSSRAPFTLTFHNSIKASIYGRLCYPASNSIIRKTVVDKHLSYLNSLTGVGLDAFLKSKRLAFALTYSYFVILS